MHDLSAQSMLSSKALIESLLLVSADPVSATVLARIADLDPGEVDTILVELSAEYADANRGIQLREVAGGWRLFTHPAFHEQVAEYITSWDTRRLSQAALETLAVIAYHQPVSREGVRAVRGVNSDGVITSLLEKKLIRETGKTDNGKAALYGTTVVFLEHFGLKSLRELPNLSDFAPDEEACQFIRDRLGGRSIRSALEDVSNTLDVERELADESSKDYDDRS